LDTEGDVMTKNVFLINGHQYWEISKGKLNKSLIELARNHLIAKDYSVQMTHIDDSYDAKAEVEKMMWADIIVFQTPVYWFSIPWGFKKYIDEVYMAGYGIMFDDDGRTRSEPEKNYGTGGLMQGKKYMLSTTWNAPLGAFNDEAEIFEGKDVDDVFFYFHKAQQFVGLERLPSFACYDVLKNPIIESDFQRYEKHLGNIF
jgi:modulator of drug activity B